MKFFIILALSFNISLFAQDDEYTAIKDSDSVYKKNDINKARFGDEDSKELIKKIKKVEEKINKKIIGQERVTKILKEKLLQTVEGFGTRSSDPVALHLIGLPGIGKSAMLQEVASVGIEMVYIDVQKFADGDDYEFMSALQSAASKSSKRPIILIFDEIDKLPEISQGLAKGKEEKTQKIIGTFNNILTNGKVALGSSTLDFSNALVVSAMNFSPLDLEEFANTQLSKPKNFYDFTINDFAKFDKWVNEKPGARDKVLSRLFRTNTVSRISPNTAIVKPLTLDNYRKIIKSVVEFTSRDYLISENENKRVTVTYTQELLDFFEKIAINPSSGARETVFRVNALIQQLLASGVKVTTPEDNSQNQPRKIKLDYDSVANKVVTTVTPRKLRRGKWILDNEKSFQYKTEYNTDARILITPDDLDFTRPEMIDYKTPEMKVTRRDVFNTRFPDINKEYLGLAEKINSELVGQSKLTSIIEDKLLNLSSVKIENLSRPNWTVMAGFPGIGKSFMVDLAAKNTGLPIVKINLQDYTSPDSGATEKFLLDLDNRIQAAQATYDPSSPDKPNKFILLIEEMDKVFEINEMGMTVDRPIMGSIKELLNSGRLERTISRNFGGSRLIKLDLRNALPFITMNFRGDLFGFEADPRLTTVSDVMNAWARLNSSLAAKKDVFSRLFLPETVSRILDDLEIVKPLNEIEYKYLVKMVAQNMVDRKFLDKDLGVNKSKINLFLSDNYFNYLYSEAIVPSEGARFTVNAVKRIISRDIDEALAVFPKSSRLASKEVELKLDYNQRSSKNPAMVSGVISATDSDLNIDPIKLFGKEVNLSFPSPKAFGKISEWRALVSIHEFGHAYCATRLGVRWQNIAVVSPTPGTGGYVKYFGGNSMARYHMAKVYSALAARAMEKIFLAPEPLERSANMYIMSGASSDIKQATKELYLMLYRLGLSPAGGVIDSENFNAYQKPNIVFDNLSRDEVRKMSRVLEEMENQIISDFLKAHTKEWYKAKIKSVALAGMLTEKGFYELIGYKYTANTNFSGFGISTGLAKEFDGLIQDESKEILDIRKSTQGMTKTTAGENLENYMKFFIESIRKNYQTEINFCGDHLSSKE